MSYNSYKNVIKMITLPEYRGLVLDSPELKENTFYSDIHLINYVIVKCREKDDKLSTTAFYITKNNSGITRTVVEFKKLMNKVQKGIKCIYIISNKDFSQQVFKTMLAMYPQYIVMKLNNAIFEDERPKHILVPKHEILSSDDYYQLVNHLTIVDPLNLPKIKINDTQCVWIGANSGDIVKITRHTIIGESINYRIVIGPMSNKIRFEYNPEFEKHQEQKEENIKKKIIVTKDDITKRKNRKKKVPNITIKLKK